MMIMDTDHLVARAHEVLAPFVDRLAGRPEVEGVAVLSSLARTGDRITFDEHSDMDITMWIHVEEVAQLWASDALVTRRAVATHLPSWLPNFTFEVPMQWGAVEINVHQRLFAYDRDERTRWDDAMREAHAYTADIVYDPHGLIRRLINDKTAMTDDERDGRLLRLAARLHWDIGQIPHAMAARDDSAAGHHVVSAAIDEVIEALYLAGRRWPPVRKWRLDGLTRYSLATADELDLINEAMRIADLGRAELLRRVGVVDRLWDMAKSKLPSHVPVGDAAYRAYSASSSANRQLRRTTVADLAHSELAATFGTEVYDLSNYLVLSSPSGLADLTDTDITALPGHWSALARQVRAALAARPSSGATS